MIKTDQGRYDDAVKYLAKVDPGLSQAAKTWTQGRGKAVGGKLSLGGKTWDADEEKREATRALLLCTVAFFGPPHNAGDSSGLDFYVGAVRDACRNMSRAQVLEEIRSYLTLPGASLEALAVAAETVKHSGPVKYHPMRLRTDVNVGKGPICYDGVFNWLFVAGFISRRWLGKHGQDIHASTIHNHLGNGQVVPVGQWDAIPRGYVWNIHKSTDRSTCHWGVSLGGGLAAACNNTGQGEVAYTEGGDTYGQFLFSDLCTVLERTEKYAGKNRLVTDAVDEESARRAAPRGQLPAGSHITVRLFSPVSGTTQNIYF